mmetsp:Transcript_24402/g.37106  ORF Transcript_24402/g.37106 Transcript_24402/m.37106 type:complete len:235 (+) Transcript_24402:698-1402(+)
MEEVMVRKCVDGLVRASVNYYVGQLLLLAYNNKKRAAVFENPDEALNLVNADVKAIRGFYESLAKETYPSLKRVILEEFEILKTIFGILWMAKQLIEEEDEDLMENAEQHASFFPRLFQSLDNDLELTKLTLGDLYSLIGGWDAERAIYEIWEQHGEEPLRALEQDGPPASGDGMLNLNKYLKQILVVDRKRPVKKGGFWSKPKHEEREEKEEQPQEVMPPPTSTPSAVQSSVF